MTVLSRARAIDPLSPTIAQALAVAYLRTGDPSRAVPLMEFVVQVEPTGFAYGILAAAAEDAHMPALAERARNEARLLDPSGLSLVRSAEQSPPTFPAPPR